jgi:hypothetical protein
LRRNIQLEADSREVGIAAWHSRGQKIQKFQTQTTHDGAISAACMRNSDARMKMSPQREATGQVTSHEFYRQQGLAMTEKGRRKQKESNVTSEGG